jgi:dephospho-CoA kinase
VTPAQSAVVPIVIGLTGGIASGKTAVSQHLAELGAHIIDADTVGHQVIAPDGEAFGPVLQAFGRDLLGPDGAIDRRKLGAKVFGDPEALLRLNAISHPLMRVRMARAIAAVRARPAAQLPPAIVLDAAILFEAGWDRLCDRVWSVEVPEEVAVERLISRSGLTREAALARLNAQWSNAQRAARANLVIRNAGTLDELRAAAKAAWQQTLQVPG